MTKWLGVAAAVVALGAGCNYGASAFNCENDTQCGAGGTCEPGIGLCSFPDPGCDSGRRFGDLAGDKSNVCVDPQPPGIDAGTPDVSVDAPLDTQACYGTGFVRVCLAAAPTQPRTIATSTTINTDDPSMCDTTMSGADNYCVLVGTTITVNATLRATGTKPLVLIASGSITVNELIDVGSHRPNATNPEFIGAGADPATCMPGTPAGARAGGAGGSFTGKGGNGGNAAGTGAGTGGRAVNGTTNITELRGGCPGQDGNGGGAGTGGHGGGAVYLIANNRIDITGPGINAAGEGGAPGAPSGGISSGAGGGGAGGMIGFDAPTITCISLLLANGGGGGEGSGEVTTGVPGEDPSTTAAAAGGAGGIAIGGDGGAGSAGAAGGNGGNASNGTSNSGFDGGGGGGGGGAGLIKGPAGSLGTDVSPVPTP
jgi:hypothetical protein